MVDHGSSWLNMVDHGQFRLGSVTQMYANFSSEELVGIIHYYLVLQGFHWSDDFLWCLTPTCVCLKTFIQIFKKMMVIWYSAPFCQMHATPEALYISFLGSPVHSWAFSTPWGVFSHQTQNYLQELSTLQLPSLPIAEYTFTPGRSVRSPDSEICILMQSSIECPTLSVQRPPIRVLTVPHMA